MLKGRMTKIRQCRFKVYHRYTVDTYKRIHSWALTSWMLEFKSHLHSIRSALSQHSSSLTFHSLPTFPGHIINQQFVMNSIIIK